MRFLQIFFGWRIWLGLTLSVLVLGGGWWYAGHPLPWDAAQQPGVTYKTPQETKSVYVRFDMEAYDDILDKYWQKASDADLAGLFALALQKAQGASSTPELATKDRAGVAQMLADAFEAATSTDAGRKQLALDTLTVALYNLAPAGRSGLLTSQSETALRQEVANINPNQNLYADLGVSKGADQNAIDSAYQAKQAQLAKATSTEAKKQLDEANYAHKVLSNENDKTRYDQAGIQPTVFTHIMGHTLYVYMSQIAPTTLQEFGQAIDHASTTPGLDSMILDLRGNIGGALDFVDAFFGLFIGQNQYVFDFYHQGDYEPQRTTTGIFPELERYKERAVLTDNMTQSTAEVLTAAFKRFHLAHVVGGTTRGWGTVENTIPLNTAIDPAQNYSILLVQYITLRDDGQPVESRGVDPDVSIADKNWKTELSGIFHSVSLISALKQEADQAPLK